MSDILADVLNHLFISLKITLTQVFILIGPGLILVVLMNFISAKVENRAYRLLGRRVYLGLFGWLGTIIHELGHALMCVVFRHRINRIDFFNPDTETGTLGYVSHSYNSESIYQSTGNFFIGIGPIVLGTIVIYFSAYYLIGESFFSPINKLYFGFQDFQSLNVFKGMIFDTWSAFGLMISDGFRIDNFTRWQFYAFLYIVFCVGSSITLSRTDLKGAISGFGVFLMALFIFNVFIHFIGIDVTNKNLIIFAKKCSFFYSTMICALFMNIILLFLLYLLNGFNALKQSFQA